MSLSKQDAPRPPLSNGSLFWQVVAPSVATGAAISVLVMHYATKGKMNHSSIQMQHSLKSLEEHILRQHRAVEQIHMGQEKTSSQLQTSLQSQALVISESLLPVAVAQKQLESINRDVTNIKNIFHSPKSLGNFGEFQLETLIQSSLPSPALYDFQYTLSNKKRVDCVVHMPLPIGKVSIDSKFPLNSFQEILVNEPTTISTTIRAKVNDSVHKHIEDIATKYILPGETADYAIMFLPSEALFLKLVTAFPKILDQANHRHVYIACPTTLIALLKQLHGTTRGLAMQAETTAMVGKVHQITEYILRLGQRFEQAEKSLEKAKTDVAKMQSFMSKILKAKAELEAMGCFTERSKGDVSKNKINATNTFQNEVDTGTINGTPILSGVNGEEKGGSRINRVDKSVLL